MTVMSKFIRLTLLLALCFALSNCARKAPLVRIPAQPREKFIIIHVEERSLVGDPIWIQGKKYYPLDGIDDFVQMGMASWYGPKFHGRKTSSGEIYDMHGSTAAHRTLPLGTYVQVVNLRNGRRAVVRINDRGPFVKNRIIDLSYGAAKQIGLVGPGVSKVKLIILGKEVGIWNSPTGPSPVLQVPNVRQGSFAVQVGCFNNRYNALSVADRLKVLFEYVEIVRAKPIKGKGKVMYRVRVSGARTLDEADRIKKRLRKIGFEEAFVVSL